MEDQKEPIDYNDLLEKRNKILRSIDGTLELIALILLLVGCHYCTSH